MPGEALDTLAGVPADDDAVRPSGCPFGQCSEATSTTAGPGTANRWTDTHVLVHWVEDNDAQDHRYELAWLRAEDVRRFLKT